MSHRKTHEQFIEEVFKLSGYDYSILDKYLDSHTKIAIKHIKCGNIYRASPTSFLSGLKKRAFYCPYCSGINKKTHETFIEQVNRLRGDEYSVLGHYVNDRTKISMRHNKCGYVYKTTPNSILNGRRCPSCFGTRKKTHEEFVLQARNLVGDEYSVLGTYINDATKIPMKHNKCGHIYMIKPNHFLQGIRCPRCSQSKGESVIANYLQKHNIHFIQEYTFPNCRDKRPLPFDFAVIDNNQIRCLIEYDGEQHFRSVGHFGGDIRLKDRIRKDRIRDDYCKANGIPLIRISYTEASIEDRLDKELQLILQATRHRVAWTERGKATMSSIANKHASRPQPAKCPVCFLESKDVALMRQGNTGWRCPSCHLLFLNPPPSVEELPELARCPECLKRGRIQVLVWLDAQIQWCPICNFSQECLTERQRILRERVTRMVVGDCYGDSCKRIKATGGRSSKNKRARGKSNRGFSIVTTIDLARVRPSQKDTRREE